MAIPKMETNRKAKKMENSRIEPETITLAEPSSGPTVPEVQAHAQAFINALTNQRNAALDQQVLLIAQIEKLQRELSMAKEQLAGSTRIQ